ncbi:MAG: asparagine synthase (glutamine-hydrolyzing) [Acidobacteriota bacterium]
MCGINGVVYFDNRPVDGEVIRRMSKVQSHRGPDESGEYLGHQAGLGHRRLSIIDLSSGQQPLTNEDGTVWISFNGEIYNYADLNRELESRHRFHTRSDTETIVHLYEECPDDFVAKLRGMFAFGLWDDRRRRLVLARDRLGKKPLYYYHDSAKLVFASEIKSILEHPNLDLEVDEQSLSDYLSLGYVPAPKSIYRQVRKVRPGHYLVCERGEIREVRYWDLQFGVNGELSEEEWLQRFLEEFRQAVAIRLMSEVPLGAFLSGGLDSSSVVALMTEILDQPVKTATIGFKEELFDESGFAQEVATHLKTDHHMRVVTPDKIQTIEKLAWHYDEPFSDSSALPTYYVSKVAREKVTVCLSGDGGDENFAGYRRYWFDLRENWLRAVLPSTLRRAVFGPMAYVYPKMDWAPQFLRAKATFQSLAQEPVEGYFESMSTFRKLDKCRALSGDVQNQLRGYDSVDVFRAHYLQSGSDDPLSRIQYLDIKTYLTDDILTKVDRASMATSLEVRCPLLDHKLMELIASMPPTLKLKGRMAKYLFKRAMERYLPNEIIHRRKMGFGVPLAQWFRGGIKDFAHEHLVSKSDPYLSSGFIRTIWHQHQSGSRDRSSQLWSVLMFRLWLDQFGHRTSRRRAA